MTESTVLRGVGIGAGYFAPFHYEAWTRIPEVKLVAICDKSEEKARAVMAKWGIPRYYSDWKQLIDAEKPNFVDIITRPENHEEMCAYAAARSVNIICQKPLAPTFEDSMRIVEDAKTAGVRLMVHENWRWQPWYRKIKEISDSGAIGAFTHIHSITRLGDGWGDNPYSPRQPYFREYPKLLLYETGVHFIDTFRFLLGEVTKAFAHLKRMNPIILGEDVGYLLLTFQSGATALWDANRYNEAEAASPRFTFCQLRIDGTKGHLTMDYDSSIRLKRLGEPVCDVPYRREDKNFAGDCVYSLQCHFTDCMLSGREFESNGEDYLNTIRVVQAAYDSALRSEVVTM